jgi:hypothetical protein
MVDFVGRAFMRISSLGACEWQPNDAFLNCYPPAASATPPRTPRLESPQIVSPLPPYLGLCVEVVAREHQWDGQEDVKLGEKGGRDQHDVLQRHHEKDAHGEGDFVDGLHHGLLLDKVAHALLRVARDSLTPRLVELVGDLGGLGGGGGGESSANQS